MYLLNREYLRRSTKSHTFSCIAFCGDFSGFAEILAVKEVNLNRGMVDADRAIANLEHEIKLLSTMSHPNIVQVHSDSA